jgi:hypothetical protein
VLLAISPLGGVGYTMPYTQQEGTTTTLAMAVRGVHVEGLEVVLTRHNEINTSVSDGRFVLIAGAGGDGAGICQSLPAGLQPRVAQGTPAEQSNRWPVFLSSGSAEVGTVTSALYIRKSDRRAADYASAVVGTGTTTTSDKSIFYIWNNGTTKRAEIRRITIAYLAGIGGNLTVKGAHINAQATTVGGTSVAPLPLDPSDGASSLGAVSGANAPTQVAVDLLSFAVPFATTGTFVWTWTDLGKPIVLPADTQYGFEIRIDVSATSSTEMKLHVSIEWLEI